VILLADSDKPPKNPQFEVRSVPYNRWTHVGCTNLGSPALTRSVNEQLLRRVSEALEFVEGISCVDAPLPRSGWIAETVRGVCNRQLNSKCSVKDLEGELKGSNCCMWLDVNDLQSEHTIYHVDRSPSLEAESEREELSTLPTANKECEPIEIKVPKSHRWQGVSASEQHQQLEKKVKDTITCLQRRASKKPLDYTSAHMRDVELVASVWPVIQSFYPKLVSEEEWKNLATLEKKVHAW
jgi:hypothetical protein